MDSVKSTVSVLEEGDFTEEGGGFNWRGVRFCWRIPIFVEECVSISRRESKRIRSRGSYFAGGGVDFDLEEGVYIIWSRGSHTLLLEDQGGVCFDLKEGSNSSEVGGDTLVGRGCI